MKIPDNIDIHNGSYRLRYTVNGKRIDKRLNPKKDKNNPEKMTDRQITAWLEKEKTRIISEATGDYSTPLPFGEVLDMYLEDKATGLRDTSRACYKGQAPRIKDELGNIRIDNLNKYLMQKFINGLPVGSQENNKFILVNVFNYAKEFKMVKDNPADCLKFQTIDKEKDFHTRDEITQILTALASYRNDRIGSYAVAQLRMFVELAVNSGMRIGDE